MFGPYFSPVGVLIPTVITFAGLAIALVRGFGSVDRWMDRWASAHGVVLTDEIRPFVTERLRRGKRWRAIGFSVGWFLPYVQMWVLRDFREKGFTALNFAFVLGYLAGALIAEVVNARDDRAPRAALLEPRYIRDYIPRIGVLVPRGLAVAAIVLAACYAAFPWRDEFVPYAQSKIAFFVTALFVLAVVLGTEAIQHMIVRRSQPYDSEAQRRADDALRSSSVGILAGVSVGVCAWIVASLLWSLGTTTDVQTIRWFAPLAGLALTILGLRTFAILADPLLQWRVRRGIAERQPA